jgi:hypothetical protein
LILVNAIITNLKQLHAIEMYVHLLIFSTVEFKIKYSLLVNKQWINLHFKKVGVEMDAVKGLKIDYI